MSIRCPACGFDSADGSQWCDFCKEPFRPRKKNVSISPSEAIPGAATPASAASNAGQMTSSLPLALNDEEISKALRSDWKDAPVVWSEKVRLAAILFLCSLLAMAIALAALILSKARLANGSDLDARPSRRFMLNTPTKE